MDTTIFVGNEQKLKKCYLWCDACNLKLRHTSLFFPPVEQFSQLQDESTSQDPEKLQKQIGEQTVTFSFI